MTGSKILHNLMKISKKTTMKKIMKDIFSKLIFKIYPDNLQNLHYDLPFLREKMINEKVEKLVADLYDETEYGTQIWNLKQAFIHGLHAEKFCGTIKLG